jgi:hypothetical protein
VGNADGDLGPELSALLTVRRLCKHFHALPSQLMGEDGGLLLQLLELEDIITEGREEVIGDAQW